MLHPISGVRTFLSCYCSCPLSTLSVMPRTLIVSGREKLLRKAFWSFVSVEMEAQLSKPKVCQNSCPSIISLRACGRSLQGSRTLVSTDTDSLLRCSTYSFSFKCLFSSLGYCECRPKAEH